VGLTAAVVVAAMGGSYWAIVVSSQLTLLIRLGLYWWTSGWLPSRPQRAPGVGPMVRFGLNLAATNVLDYAGLNADNVLIGHAYGSTTLGLYSRAYNLLLMPVNQIHQPVARVAVPVLSYLEDQPERFRRYFKAAVSAVAYVAMPLIATAAALSKEIIVVLLGRRWVGAAPIFEVLAVAGILNILRNPNVWLFTSTGHTGRQSTWALINRPIMILGFVLGLPWGAIGVAWAYTITNLVLLVPACAWAVKDTPVRLRDLATAGWRPFVIAAAAFTAAASCRAWLPAGWDELETGALGLLAAAAAIAATVSLWPGARRQVRELRSAFSRAPGETTRGETTAVEASTRTINEPDVLGEANA
jgi:PST family polysaccharide transporter